MIKTFFVYTYRYSGEFRELGTMIDELATAIWENVSIMEMIQEKLKLFLHKYYL